MPNRRFVHLAESDRQVHFYPDGLYACCPICVGGLFL